MPSRTIHALALLCALLLPPAATADENRAMPSSFAELNAIVKATDLTPEQKVARLRGYLTEDLDWQAVFAWMAQVDRAAAQRIALEEFRKDDTTRKNKLQLCRVLLQRRYLAEDTADEERVREVARFLVGAVLEGGQQEFDRERERTMSAVGEYAFIASDFEGYTSIPFEPFKDRRVSRILTHCVVNAPDHVYGQARRGCMDGEPGASTRRNVQRQQIPVALAKLGATEAVKDLRKVVATHPDYYTRANAAYALGVLMKAEESARLAIRLQKKAVDNREHCHLLLFHLGKGLIEAGNDAGVEYMDFKYSAYADDTDWSSVSYMLSERLDVLDGFRSDHATDFYRNALTYAPLKQIFLFDEAMLAPATGRKPRLDNLERITELYDQLLDQVAANKHFELTPLVREIGTGSKSPEIRARSMAFWLQAGAERD